MSIMRSILTGALSVPVERQQIKFANTAEMDLFNKKLDAEFTNNVALKEKEIELGIAEDQRKEDEAMSKRKNFLLALGFTPEYLDFKGNGIIVSDGAMNSFLDLNKKKYGVESWWDTPTAFAPKGQGTVGKNIQEIELGGFGITSGSNFNKDTVTSNVKNNNNLSDNITDVELGNYKDDKTNASNFNYGTNYFFAKPTQKQSEGQYYVNPNVENPVYAFQVEETPGAGFGADWYIQVVGKDGKTNLQQLNMNSGWVPMKSDVGKKIAEQNLGLFDISVTQKDLMVKINGKAHYIGGKEIKRGNEIETVINYVPSAVANHIGFNAIGYETTPGPVGPESTKTAFLNTFEMPLEAFTANYPSLTVLPYKSEEVLKEPSVRESTSLLNVKRGADFGAGIIFGKDAFSAQEVPGQEGVIRMTVIGNEPQLESALGAYTQILLGTETYIQNLGENDVLPQFTEALGLTKNADYNTIVNEITTTFGELRNGYETRFLDMIENGDPEIDIRKADAGVLDTAPALVAKKLADYEMGKLNSPFKLITAIDIFNQREEDKQIQTTQTIQTAIEKAFPSALTTTDDLTKPVEDSNSQFINYIKENVTSEALEFLRDADSQEELDEYKGFESLQKAISDITQGVDGEGDAEQYLLLSQEAFRIINAVARGDEDAPFKIEDVREKDITQRTEAFGTEMSTEALTNKWLTENSVDTDSDDIRPGAKVTISGIGKDIIAKNDAGGTNASFFDPNTGYLIFKNPSLPPGHVDPRPTAKFMGFTSKSQENWDILYGKTHKPDGTPLKPYE